MLCGESKMLKELGSRAACSKTGHGDTCTVQANIFAPSEVAQCLYCNTLAHFFREYGLFIFSRLLLKKIHARHGYDADLLALCCQDCFCLYRKLYLGTGSDEDQVRGSLAVIDDITAL